MRIRFLGYDQMLKNLLESNHKEELDAKAESGPGAAAVVGEDDLT